jgi:hypothetical protein
MAQYILLIGGAPLDPKFVPEPQYTQVKEKYAAWRDKLRSKTAMKSAHKLQAGDGRRVTLQSGQAFDGPFAETKETVCGLFFIEAANYEEAVALARENPTMLYQGGYVEVREVIATLGSN